jgi:hypothetical protein
MRTYWVQLWDADWQYCSEEVEARNSWAAILIATERVRALYGLQPVKTLVQLMPPWLLSNRTTGASTT